MPILNTLPERAKALRHGTIIERVHCYVSQSIVNKTLDYISNQEMHHKRFSFQDEYKQFLVSYGVEYDEAYVY